MASNDGQRLTVFGLGFRQHDSRNMHRILDHYERLPPNANDRVALYTTLTALARTIPQEEAQSIETWLANGGRSGAFPFTRPVRERDRALVVPAYDYGTDVPRHFGHPRHMVRPQYPGPPEGLHFGGGHEFDDEDADEEEEEFNAGPALAQRPRPPRHVLQHAGMNQQHNMPNMDVEFHQGIGRGIEVGPIHGFGRPGMPVGPHGNMLHRPRRDPLMGHGPPMPANRHAFGLYGGRDPLVDHGPPVQFHQNHTAFDVTGSGRRLGEEGEDTTIQDRNDFNPVEAAEYEDIFHDARDNFDEEIDENAENIDHLVDPSNPWGPTPEDLSEVQNGGSTQFNPTPSLPIIECEICYESYPSSEFPFPKITALCQHEAKVCFKCLEQCIGVQIQEGVLGQLNCPSCPEKLSYENIKVYASPEVFKR
jgi:hypothetical protein